MDLIAAAEAAVADKERAVRQSRDDDHATYAKILLRHRHPFPGDGGKLADLMTLLDRTADDVAGDIDALEKLNAVQEEVDQLAEQLDELDPAPDLQQRLQQLDRELAVRIHDLLEPKRQLMATIKRRRDLDEQMDVAARRKDMARRELDNRFRR